MKAVRHLTLLWHIGRQMGWHYVLFRAGYWLQAKTGILKLRFPGKATSRSFISIREWRNHNPAFLFDPQKLDLEKNASLMDLKWRVEQIKAGRFRYFSSRWFEVPDWHTNPLTAYRYRVDEHWSQVNDFPAEAGDIKFVWEKSRFTFLYDLVRYDYHFSEDQSKTVFGLIVDWVDRNPVNCGPNWKCSQEIALRVLNWTFALHYYRTSPMLKQSLLDKILCSIYDQMRHVAENLRFSEIAVRNNHVLTEALSLFTTGLTFPCFPESNRWKNEGKRLFEEKVVSQIAADGTYLQFSMNYHRVVLQLMSWGIRLAELHGDPVCEGVYSRGVASLTFLRTCQNDENGQLPNYGHNDGALFFPLTECSFRDFRPQMATLANMLGVDLDYPRGSWAEESAWFAGNRPAHISALKLPIKPVSVFETGGYHIIRDAEALMFLRCGGYYSRPFQADHNHLDIWVNGRNILRDAGTWLYNTDKQSTRYFSGTRGHNTVMIGDFDQMQKQARFIWTHWIVNAKGQADSSDHEFWIDAEFEGFRHLGKGIVHQRRVVKKKGQLYWVIKDHVTNVPFGMRIRQLWHPDEAFLLDFRINAVDGEGNEIRAIVENGWYSEVYGEKRQCEALVFGTFGSSVTTVIEAYES